jgi:cytochrome c-type biogenesis protein CcmH/NrfG
MPAVTFWLFATGGLALAAPADAVAVRVPAPLGRIVLALGCLVLALVPARLYLSEGPLRDGARAFARDDCPTTIDRALDAASALGVRPEPFVLLGYCDVRLGRPDLAVRALANAVRKDPDNWEGHYGLALVRAADGRDPRPELRLARRLNPREPLVPGAQRLFATNDPRAWRRRAPQARLPAS